MRSMKAKRWGQAIALLVAPVTLASCEWLAGIRDLDAQKADASRDAAMPPIDAQATPEAASPPNDGGLVLDGGVNPAVLNRRLALGSTHSCVLRQGSVHCWGANAFGQVGAGLPAIQAEPRRVAGVSDVLSIVAGNTHTCALDSRRHVLCWGKGDHNQLGGKPGDSGIVDVPLSAEQGSSLPALQIAAGVRHTCALVGAGAVRCWGDNAFGQLGNGTKTDTTSIVVPTGLDSGIVAVFAAGFFTCAVKANESMVCWGENTYGQLGDRSKTMRMSPVAVRDLEGAVRDVGLGQFTSCAITLGGALSCWGRNRIVGEPAIPFGLVVPFAGSPTEVLSPASRGDAGSQPPLLTNVAVGTTHACARTLAENALCWGSNAKGQLAREPDGGALAGYHDVPGLAGVVKEIAVGLGHSCVLAPNDEVYCWGQNDSGQLGTPTGAPRAKPDRVRFAP
jgi:alpha-tubulin suppressor-like RCC1 family protein